jgi:peptidoglycan/xylan/chitin deacetylase (PgdA/CDA1 family)
MRGVVLGYHSQNCGGYDYSSNNHLAFQSDLRSVYRHNLPVISLRDIAEKISSGNSAALPPRFVALSCDDGSLLDWHDYEHPQFGLQRSFANILRDHLTEHGLRGTGLLTAFVIASPDARKAIDIGCYGGIPLSEDDWWPAAAREGLLAIENHSWDHVHPELPEHLLEPDSAGNFYSIDSHAKADLQVRTASEFIDRHLAATGQRTSLFAYPYGHDSTFLSQDYLPRCRQEHGIIGAFTTEPKFVDAKTAVYEIPRMVCGDAWRTPEQFDDMLKQLIAD